MMPDETNITDGPGLDEDWAKKNFLGKTVADARQMFRADDRHSYTEDFTYLSDLAVRYYLPAVLDYVASEDSVDDFQFVGGIALSLSQRLKDKSLAAPTKSLAQEFARLVLSNLEKYDFEPDCELDKWRLGQLEFIAGESHGDKSND